MIKSSYMKQCVKQSVKQAYMQEAASKVMKFLAGHKTGHKPTVIVSVNTSNRKGSNVRRLTPFYKHLVSSGLLPETITEQEYLANPGKWAKHNVIAPMLEKVLHKNLAVGALPADLDNKMKESKLYSKFMPETLSGARGEAKSMLKYRNPRAAMDSRFGENKWILKPVTGAATEPGDVLTPGNITEMHGGSRKLEVRLKNGKVHTFDPRTMLVQQKHDISAPAGYAAADQLLEKVMPKSWLKLIENVRRGTQEYRVHVLNGKVVPEGTVARGSMSQHLMSLLSPVRTPSMRKVEGLASDVAGSMSERNRKGLYGFDVGIDKETGKPFLIETNPGTNTGASGFLDTPTGASAVAAAYEGRVPITRRIKQGILGLGGLGAVGAGGLAYEHHKNQEPDSTASIYGRLKQHTGMQA